MVYVIFKTIVYIYIYVLYISSIFFGRIMYNVRKFLYFTSLILFLNLTAIRGTTGNESMTITYQVETTTLDIKSSFEPLLLNGLATAFTDQVLAPENVDCAIDSLAGASYRLTCTIDGLTQAQYVGGIIRTGNALISANAEFTVVTLESVIVHTRTIECGNGVLETGEDCDSDTGCSDCVIIDGYKCYNDGPNEKTRCLNPCNISATDWHGTDEHAAGEYCSSRCKDFTAPDGYQHKENDECDFIDTNECLQGISLCDPNAYCSNIELTFPEDTDKYTCRCDPHFFTSQINGRGCDNNGIEIVIYVQSTLTGVSSSWQTELSGIRDQVINSLVLNEFTTTTAAVLQEAVVDFPIEQDSDQFIFKIRIPMQYANTEALNSVTIFDSGQSLGDLWANEISDYTMKTSNRCSNELTRHCSENADCLPVNGASTCISHPLFSINVLNSGGSTSPIIVSSSGMQLISFAFNTEKQGWDARIRYDNTKSNVMDVLYVSHINNEIETSAESLATFNIDEFPCQPTGSLGLFQNNRVDNVCCLESMVRDYTTTQAFSEYMSGTGELGKY